MPSVVARLGLPNSSLEVSDGLPEHIVQVRVRVCE